MTNVKFQPNFVILYDFDQFILRSNQFFLYKILDATRNLPIFALCVTSVTVSLASDTSEKLN